MWAFLTVPSEVSSPVAAFPWLSLVLRQRLTVAESNETVGHSLDHKVTPLARFTHRSSIIICVVASVYAVVLIWLLRPGSEVKE